MRRIRRAAKDVLLAHRPAWFWRYVELRHGLLEPELALLPLLCRRDQDSLDIGASEGMYLHHLVKHSRRCVAFEPRPDAAARLRRGYRARATIHAVALSDRDGTAELRIPAGMTGYSTIEAANRYEGKLDGADVARITVPVRRLDDLAPAEVAFVKIDVEGHEESVLRGAPRLLATSRPALLIEIEERHNPGSIARVTALLAAAGYQRLQMSEGARNFVFLPEHRAHELDDLRA